MVVSSLFFCNIHTHTSSNLLYNTHTHTHTHTQVPIFCTTPPQQTNQQIEQSKKPHFHHTIMNESIQRNKNKHQSSILDLPSTTTTTTTTVNTHTHTWQTTKTTKPHGYKKREQDWLLLTNYPPKHQVTLNPQQTTNNKQQQQLMMTNKQTNNK